MKKSVMKKVAVAVLTLGLLLGLVACGGKPKDMDQKTYDIGVQAVEVTQSYLDGKTTSSRTEAALSTCYDQLDAYTPTSASAESHRQVKTCILLLETEFFIKNIGGSGYSDSDVKEYLAELKKALNL